MDRVIGMGRPGGSALRGSYPFFGDEFRPPANKRTSTTPRSWPWPAAGPRHRVPLSPRRRRAPPEEDSLRRSTDRAGRNLGRRPGVGSWKSTMRNSRDDSASSLSFSGAAALLLLVAAFCVYPVAQPLWACALAALAFVFLGLSAPGSERARVSVERRGIERRRRGAE